MWDMTERERQTVTEYFNLSNWKDEIARNSDAGDYKRDRFEGEIWNLSFGDAEFKMARVAANGIYKSGVHVWGLALVL